MANQEQKTNKRRIRGAYVTSTISISLVLFMIGLVGLLGLNAKKLSDYVKENINFSIVLKNDTREVDIIRLQKELDASPMVKSTEYITKERAAREFTQSLGEDFVGFLGYNPLLSSIEVKLYAQYANDSGITIFSNKLKNNPLIEEVVYEKTLIHLVNENIKKISIVLLAFSVLLFLIAIALMNNMVRLLVHSKRFIIRTMQLVGATRGFIRKPFLFRCLLHGLIASLISILLIAGLLYYVNKEFADLLYFVDFITLGILFSGLMVLGIIMNLISTFFAINKYLNIDVDKLY